MTSESGSDLVSRILTFNEFQTLGAENRKARDPKVKLWRGTESWWELDERRDLVGSWYCRRPERYGGWPVCKALKVEVASLNHIRHSIGSQWNWLRSSVEDSEMSETAGAKQSEPLHTEYVGGELCTIWDCTVFVCHHPGQLSFAFLRGR